MKLNIAKKLLLMMLLIAMVVSLTSIMIRLSFVRGFSSYIAKMELSKTDNLARSLQAEYAKGGNWDFIKADPQSVWRLIYLDEAKHHRGHQPSGNGYQPGIAGPPTGHEVATPAPPNQAGERPGERAGALKPDLAGPGAGETPFDDGGPPDQLPPDPPPSEPLMAGAGAYPGLPPGPLPPTMPPPLPPHRMEVFRQVGIFDQADHFLWGNRQALESKESLPIFYNHEHNNELIGRIKMVQTQRLSSQIEREFIDQQNRHLLLFCLADFVLVSACAFIFSKHLVSAIDILVAGTRKLAAGDYATRIDLNRSDELGELSRDFNSLAMALEAQDQAHKQWITDTSHELRTPIAVLRAQVEALEDGVHELTPKTLSVLHGQIMAMSKLVDDLHDLSKSDAGALTYRFVPVDVWLLLQESVDAFADRFKNKKIAVEMFMVNKSKSVVRADGDRLQQLFANLLENSLRYTNEGGTLRMEGWVDGDWFSLLFDDSEPGLAKEHLPRIFDRFFRAESSRSRMFGGTGLGLAICKTIVEAHGGSISAAPSPLGGLRLEVRLPLLRNA